MELLSALIAMFGIVVAAVASAPEDGYDSDKENKDPNATEHSADQTPDENELTGY